MNKPIAIHKLTQTQIALVDRLAVSENGLPMKDLEYAEVAVYQELERLGMADMEMGRRRRLAIVLTDLGRQVRANGYFSMKPVIRLTEPQIRLLRFLATAKSAVHFKDIPPPMIDVCRRMCLRGWVKWEETSDALHEAHLTAEGRQILVLIDS